MHGARITVALRTAVLLLLAITLAHATHLRRTDELRAVFRTKPIAGRPLSAAGTIASLPHTVIPEPAAVAPARGVTNEVDEDLANTISSKMMGSGGRGYKLFYDMKALTTQLGAMTSTQTADRWRRSVDNAVVLWSDYGMALSAAKREGVEQTMECPGWSWDIMSNMNDDELQADRDKASAWLHTLKRFGEKLSLMHGSSETYYPLYVLALEQSDSQIQALWKELVTMKREDSDCSRVLLEIYYSQLYDVEDRIALVIFAIDRFPTFASKQSIRMRFQNDLVLMMGREMPEFEQKVMQIYSKHAAPDLGPLTYREACSSAFLTPKYLRRMRSLVLVEDKIETILSSRLKKSVHRMIKFVDIYRADLINGWRDTGDVRWIRALVRISAVKHLHCILESHGFDGEHGCEAAHAVLRDDLEKFVLTMDSKGGSEAFHFNGEYIEAAMYYGLVSGKSMPAWASEEKVEKLCKRHLTRSYGSSTGDKEWNVQIQTLENLATMVELACRHVDNESVYGCKVVEVPTICAEARSWSDNAFAFDDVSELVKGITKEDEAEILERQKSNWQLKLVRSSYNMRTHVPPGPMGVFGVPNALSSFGAGRVPDELFGNTDVCRLKQDLRGPLEDLKQSGVALEPKVWVPFLVNYIRHHYQTQRLQDLQSLKHQIFDDLSSAFLYQAGLDHDPSSRRGLSTETNVVASLMAFGDCREHATAMTILYDYLASYSNAALIKELSNQPSGGDHALLTYYIRQNIQKQIRTMNGEFFIPGVVVQMYNEQKYSAVDPTHKHRDFVTLRTMQFDADGFPKTTEYENNPWGRQNFWACTDSTGHTKVILHRKDNSRQFTTQEQKECQFYTLGEEHTFTLLADFSNTEGHGLSVNYDEPQGAKFEFADSFYSHVHDDFKVENLLEKYFTDLHAIHASDAIREAVLMMDGFEHKTNGREKDADEKSPLQLGYTQTNEILPMCADPTDCRADEGYAVHSLYRAGDITLVDTGTKELVTLPVYWRPTPWSTKVEKKGLNDFDTYTARLLGRPMTSFDIKENRLIYYVFASRLLGFYCKKFPEKCLQKEYAKLVDKFEKKYGFDPDGALIEWEQHAGNIDVSDPIGYWLVQSPWAQDDAHAAQSARDVAKAGDGRGAGGMNEPGKGSSDDWRHGTSEQAGAQADAKDSNDKIADAEVGNGA